MGLPKNYRPFIDKYFLRAKEILKAEELNPFVRAQVFVRKGPGKIYGINEAVAILDKYSKLSKNRGRVFSLEEGSNYSPTETLMVIEARIQDIVDLETMYLGVISAETTKRNDNVDIDLKKVEENMAKVFEASGRRPVSYFGARHWRYDLDSAISRAAFDGGASSCSTDVGAEIVGKVGIGTIPHALEAIYAWKYGMNQAVSESTRAFDKVMDPKIPRIALVDFANREILDSLKTAEFLEGRLYGVRLDTCGENVAEGAIRKINCKMPQSKYWFGKGVTASSAFFLRENLDKFGFNDVKIMLSSGFGNPEKVKAFVDAEKYSGKKLFDALGVGGIFQSRFSTMDIVGVGDDLDNLQPISKIGRYYKPNSRLELVLGGK